MPGTVKFKIPGIFRWYDGGMCTATNAEIMITSSANDAVFVASVNALNRQ